MPSMKVEKKGDCKNIKKSEGFLEFIPSQSDYWVAFNAAKKQMNQMGIASVEAMEPHDFAIEAIMLSQRWGGRSYLARRAKLLVLEKFRKETGTKKGSVKRHRNMSLGSLEVIQNVKESCSKSDVEEIMDALNIPDRLKNMIFLKACDGLSNKQVGEVLGMKETSVSEYFGRWSCKLIPKIEKMSEKHGYDLLRSCKKRSVRKFLCKR